jgi:hypothetical protein
VSTLKPRHTSHHTPTRQTFHRCDINATLCQTFGAESFESFFAILSIQVCVCGALFHAIHDPQQSQRQAVLFRRPFPRQNHRHFEHRDDDEAFLTIKTVRIAKLTKEIPNSIAYLAVVSISPLFGKHRQNRPNLLKLLDIKETCMLTWCAWVGERVGLKNRHIRVPLVGNRVS